MSPVTSRLPGQIPTLDDGVVTLRAPAATDTAAIVEYAREAEMIRWTSVPNPYAAADAESFLALALDGWAGGDARHFAIQTQDRFAGLLDVHPGGTGRAEIGYGLAAWARGHGVMTRALRLGLTWAFGQPGIEILHWRAQVGNWAGRRAAWAVGFQVGEAVPGLLTHRGKPVDGWIGTLRRGQDLRPAHAWLDPEPISGRGLLLREHREHDLPRLLQAGRDRQTRHWISAVPADYTPAHLREHLLRMRSDQAAGRAVGWAVADPDDDRILAEIMLFVLDGDGRQAEVGYWTHPDARGRGVATEAVRLAVRHAMLPITDGGLGLSRVLLRAAADNLGSQRVARKNGFTPTGTDRRTHRQPDGSMIDTVRFDLLADELPAVR